MSSCRICRARCEETKYAARAQALCQLLVRLRMAPAGSRLNRAMTTQVVAECLAARLKMMRRGSRPEVLTVKHRKCPLG